MKSGKSLELIAQVAPYEYTDKKMILVQPEANVRDTGIQSRLGINAAATAIKSLNLVDSDFDVIGIDEVHMFDKSDSRVINKWLLDKKIVVASGLDLDFRGKLMPIVKNLIELKPDIYINKKSVCEVCKNYDAQFTQILSDNIPVLTGLPAVVPEDGTFQYEARCRDCFVK